MPADFRIENPFRLRLSVMEIDKQIPSFRASVVLSCPHPTGEFSYSASDLWFQCSQWDEFETSVRTFLSSDHPEIRLRDMSDLFLLRISPSASTHLLRLHITEPETGSGEATLSILFPLPGGVLQDVEQSLRSFPKWWKAR